MTGLNWLASYPRSGNTWARLLLAALRHGGSTDLRALDRFGVMAVGRSMIDAAMACDSGVMTTAETQALRPHVHAAMAAATPGAVVKVHDAWQRLPDGSPVHDAAVTHRAIYLIRDPRDVAVSWARFTGMELDQAIGWMADEAAALSSPSAAIGIQIPHGTGSWSDNVTSWIDDSELSPLVVRFEDMLADTPGRLRLIADHLGWRADDDAIEMAVRSTTFGKLARDERRSSFAERPSGTAAFFRSGRAGDWRAVLSDAQAARIERDHGPVMARFGYR